MQERLRKIVRLAKAYNDDIYYKDFAEFLGITEHSFYNWLKGYYEFGADKAKKLESIIIDLIEEE